jgi:hypothetical protein
VAFRLGLKHCGLWGLQWHKNPLSDNLKAQKPVQQYPSAKSWKKRARANRGKGPDRSTIGSTLGKRPAMKMGGTKEFGGKLKRGLLGVLPVVFYWHSSNFT